MKIALYFGSFNPVHNGHLIVANYIVTHSEVEQLWFVVSPQNPLKTTSTLLNEFQRLFLVRLAVEDDSQFRVSDVEFKLPKPSFTINTMLYLEKKFPQYKFYIVMGSDGYKNFSKWKDFETLHKKYEIIIYQRPGHLIKENEIVNKNIILLRTPLLEISATLIRHKIKVGESIRYLVPEKVREEIEKGGYYK